MNNYQSIPFKDEDGKEKEFYVLEQTTLNGFHYLLVEDGSADADDEEVEVLIMKRVADAAEDEEWATYEMVEDEEELISVSKVFEQLMDDINFEVEEGEFVAVIGTSGSGKSTLLNMIGGLDRPTSGSVTIRGKELLKMKDEELTIFRRRNIGFVFQNYNLLPVLNVYENIVYPIEIDGGKTDTGFVKEIIQTLGLERKLKNMPNNLSGGQQQRVAIARALATKPAIILADEPTGNLDSKTSQDVLGLLKVTGKRFHQTIVMITHNEEIAQMADRILQIEDGKIVSDSGLV